MIGYRYFGAGKPSEITTRIRNLASLSSSIVENYEKLLPLLHDPDARAAVRDKVGDKNLHMVCAALEAGPEAIRAEAEILAFIADDTDRGDAFREKSDDMINRGMQDVAPRHQQLLCNLFAWCMERKNR